jgi:hypothetical protein
MSSPGTTREHTLDQGTSTNPLEQADEEAVLRHAFEGTKIFESRLPRPRFFTLCQEETS